MGVVFGIIPAGMLGCIVQARLVVCSYVIMLTQTIEILQRKLQG